MLPLSDGSGENFPCLSHASDAGHSAYALDAEKLMALMMLKTDGAIEDEGAWVFDINLKTQFSRFPPRICILSIEMLWAQCRSCFFKKFGFFKVSPSYSARCLWLMKR